MGLLEKTGIAGLLTCPLRYAERLTLAWQLTWPAVVTDVIWSFTVYVLLEIKQQGAELLYLIPYLLVVGPRDEEAGTVSVRLRGVQKDSGAMPLDGFVRAVANEIAAKVAVPVVGAL